MSFFLVYANHAFILSIFKRWVLAEAAHRGENYRATPSPGSEKAKTTLLSGSLASAELSVQAL